MYANYWGLAEIPFRNTIDTRWFYQSQVHEEALARLLFLVENHRRCGVLSGAAGTGKSLLLGILGREAARTGGEVAHIDLFGRSSLEMLWEIVAELGVPAGPDDAAPRLWRTLHDHILANRYAPTRWFCCSTILTGRTPNAWLWSRGCSTCLPEETRA